MSLNAAALKILEAKGLTTSEIVELAEALELGVHKSTGAVRQARYREKKRAQSVTSDVTNDVTGDVTPPPIEEIIPPSSEANASGGKPPADPLKELFDIGVSILTASGQTEKEARSLIGMWRKKGDGKVLEALLECRAKAISSPLEWLQARLKPAKWVSASGYEYRGSDQDVLRESERRGDMSTYWAVKSAMQKADKPDCKAKSNKRSKSVSVGQLTAGFLQAGAN